MVSNRRVICFQETNVQLNKWDTNRCPHFCVGREEKKPSKIHDVVCTLCSELFHKDVVLVQLSFEFPSSLGSFFLNLGHVLCALLCVLCALLCVVLLSLYYHHCIVKDSWILAIVWILETFLERCSTYWMSVTINIVAVCLEVNWEVGRHTSLWI